MKINFSTVLTSLTGEPLKVDDKGNVLTLAKACTEALLAMNPQAQESGTDKFEAYQLAQKIHAGGEVEILPADAERLKTKIAAIYGPAVVGPAYALLNG